MAREGKSHDEITYDSDRFIDVFTNLIQHFGTRISNAQPLGDEAIIIAPKADQNWELLATELEVFLAPCRWIVTSKIQSIIIEPHRAGAAPAKQFLFHVTRRCSVAAILQSGLQPRTGGSTAFQRCYPPRLHLARTLSAAFCFVDFQSGRHSGASSLPNFCAVWPSDLAVLRVRHVPQRQYFTDPMFPREGVYVEEIIPPADITTVLFWQMKKRLYDYGVKHGWW